MDNGAFSHESKTTKQPYKATPARRRSNRSGVESYQKDAGMITSLHPYFERKNPPVKIGVFAVGLDNYWPQFDGLKEQLLGYHKEFLSLLASFGADVFDAGLCDNPRVSQPAGQALRQFDPDILLCNVVTYTPAANVLPVVQRVARPVVLLGLQPESALNYRNATTYQQLCNDNVTSLPEISCALQRANIPIADIIFGRLHNDGHVRAKMEQFCRVGRCLHVLRQARIGLMGHVYEGMLDMNHDPTMFDAFFGMHIEHIEMDDLQEHVDSVENSAIDERIDLIRDLFHFPAPGSDPIAGEVDADELRWAATVSIGMEHLIEEYKFDGLAYYYKGATGSVQERLGSNLIIASSLLTGRGIPIAGEYDTKTCIAMLIMDRLSAGGSFAELHPADFDDDFVLVGHDGPHHIAISEGKPFLRGLSVLHGKKGRGPSVEFCIKHGPITMLGVTQTYDGRFAFVVAEGESMPGPIPATGNTNTRGKFKPDVRGFVENWSKAGPTHHFALGIGHQADAIEMLATILDIECVTITRG